MKFNVFDWLLRLVHALLSCFLLSSIDDLVFIFYGCSKYTFFFFNSNRRMLQLSLVCTLEGGNRKKGAHMRIIYSWPYCFSQDTHARFPRSFALCAVESIRWLWHTLLIDFTSVAKCTMSFTKRNYMPPAIANIHATNKCTRCGSRTTYFELKCR